MILDGCISHFPAVAPPSKCFPSGYLCEELLFTLPRQAAGTGEDPWESMNVQVGSWNPETQRLPSLRFIISCWNPIRLAIGKKVFLQKIHRRLTTFSQSSKVYCWLLPGLPITLQNGQMADFLLDKHPQLFGIISHGEGVHKAGTGTMSPWEHASYSLSQALGHPLWEPQGWVMEQHSIFLPIPSHIPAPAALILTGTSSPWRMGRTGFSSCCCCVLELGVAGASSASAELHWTSLQCCLLLWSRTSMTGRATGLKRGPVPTERNRFTKKKLHGHRFLEVNIGERKRLGETRRRAFPFSPMPSQGPRLWTPVNPLSSWRWAVQRN